LGAFGARHAGSCWFFRRHVTDSTIKVQRFQFWPGPTFSHRVPATPRSPCIPG
jgi:hypothetical protein